MQLATYVSDGSRSMGPHYSQYINTKPTSHKSANRVMHNLNLAHGKTFLYQFFYLQFFTIQFVSLFYYFTVCKKKHTAKSCFAVCQKNTRQSISLLCAKKSTRQMMTLPCTLVLPCVFLSTLRQNLYLPCARELTHGKLWYTW